MNSHLDRVREASPGLAGTTCITPHDHEVDLALSSDLEALADLLPSLPPGSDLRRLTERLHAASERWSRTDVVSCSHAPLHVHDYNLLDALHAADVADAIWEYWRHPDPQAAECLGYMLRSLFDGRRRAIMIERLALGCSQCQSSAID